MFYVFYIIYVDLCESLMLLFYYILLYEKLVMILLFKKIEEILLFWGFMKIGGIINYLELVELRGG